MTVVLNMIQGHTLVILVPLPLSLKGEVLSVLHAPLEPIPQELLVNVHHVEREVLPMVAQLVVKVVLSEPTLLEVLYAFLVQ